MSKNGHLLEESLEGDWKHLEDLVNPADCSSHLHTNPVLLLFPYPTEGRPISERSTNRLRSHISASNSTPWTGVVPRICISNKFPGEPGAAGPQIAL